MLVRRQNDILDLEARELVNGEEWCSASSYIKCAKETIDVVDWEQARWTNGRKSKSRGKEELGGLPCQLLPETAPEYLVEKRQPPYPNFASSPESGQDLVASTSALAWMWTKRKKKTTCFRFSLASHFEHSEMVSSSNRRQDRPDPLQAFRHRPPRMGSWHHSLRYHSHKLLLSSSYSIAYVVACFPTLSTPRAASPRLSFLP